MCVSCCRFEWFSCVLVFLCCMVLVGLIWYGRVWFGACGVVCSGSVWFDVVRFGLGVCVLS